MNHFLTKAERNAIIAEALEADTDYIAASGLTVDAYRQQLESMNNYDLIQVCCNV